MAAQSRLRMTAAAGSLRARLVAALWLCCAAAGVAAATPTLPPLTTAEGSPRLPGKFVWADLVTDDVAAARKFYGGLFGWTFQDLGGYTICANDERPLCGMFQRSRPTNGDARPRWFGFISVPNVARAERAVKAAGGRVVAERRKMPGRGEQAVFADPEGALFGVVKSSAGDPEDFLADPGDWVWIQLMSRDAHKAAEFYQSVAGYEVMENTASNRLSDYVLARGGFARAVVRTIPAGNEQPRPTWLLFVRVKDIGESVAKAKELGGRVLVEPDPGRFDGKVAVVADPTGAAIGLLEWSPELMKGTP
jgi:predicted enzyme related to lactoylglutathione lyase